MSELDEAVGDLLSNIIRSVVTVDGEYDPKVERAVNRASDYVVKALIDAYNRGYDAAIAPENAERTVSIKLTMRQAAALYDMLALIVNEEQDWPHGGMFSAVGITEAEEMLRAVLFDVEKNARIILGALSGPKGDN